MKSHQEVKTIIEEANLPMSFKPVLDWLSPAGLSPKQANVLSDDNYIILLVAANGVGKTLIECVDVASMIMGLNPKQYLGVHGRKLLPPVRIRHLAPSYDTGVKGVLLKKYLGDGVNPPLIPHELIKTNFTDKMPQMVLWNPLQRDESCCSWLHFATYEQKISQQKGAEFDMVVFDEQPPDTHWEENRQRLRSAKDGRGHILVGMTAEIESAHMMNWTYEKLWCNPDPLISKHCISKYDLLGYHPNITKESIEVDRRMMSEEEFKVRVMGEYVALAGRLYPEYKDDYQPQGHLLERFSVSVHAGWPVMFAMDWHDRKPCAAVWATRDKYGNVIIFDELKRRETENKTIREVADIIKEKERAYGVRGEPEYRLIDSNSAKKENSIIVGYNAFEEFARQGIYCIPASNDMTRVDMVKRYLKSDDHKLWPQVRVFDDCTDLRHDMQYVQYEDFRFGDDRDPKSGKIKDRYKCLPDCLSYILARESMEAKPDEEPEPMWMPKQRTVNLRGGASLGGWWS